jgi:hypothetical protein
MPSGAHAASLSSDERFMLDVLAAMGADDDARAEDLPRDRQPPNGDRWVHMSPLAVRIDEAAAATGRGRGWRSAVQPPGGLRAMLASEPIASLVEMQQVRFGPSGVDWWVRMRPGPDAATDESPAATPAKA